MNQCPPGTVAPAFIACGARTGSTLLSWLIDSHPDIACPPETDFALLIEAFIRTSSVLRGETGAGKADPPAAVPTLREARQTVDALACRYLADAGKKRWCDKSLTNVLHLATIAAVWPDARFILLHRHVMDFAASALEAEPWGLHDYGFAPFAAATPGDSIGALVAYWLDRTRRMLAFQQSYPARCLSMRYEDLVTQTDEELARLWDFLDVMPAPEATSRAFTEAHGAGGPGDSKIWYTSGVHADSLGRGGRIPAQVISPAALRAVNSLARALGYPPVGPDWGAGGDTSDVSSLEVRVIRGYGAVRTARMPLPADAPGPAVIAVEEDAVSDLRGQRDNPAALMRARRIRYYGPDLPSPAAERAMIDLVTACLLRADG